jgi:hypothetical protein
MTQMLVHLIAALLARGLRCLATLIDSRDPGRLALPGSPLRGSPDAAPVMSGPLGARTGTPSASSAELRVNRVRCRAATLGACCAAEGVPGMSCVSGPRLTVVSSSGAAVDRRRDPASTPSSDLDTERTPFVLFDGERGSERPAMEPPEETLRSSGVAQAHGRALPAGIVDVADVAERRLGDAAAPPLAVLARGEA